MNDKSFVVWVKIIYCLSKLNSMSIESYQVLLPHNIPRMVFKIKNPVYYKYLVYIEGNIVLRKFNSRQEGTDYYLIKVRTFSFPTNNITNVLKHIYAVP